MYELFYLISDPIYTAPVNVTRRPGLVSSAAMSRSQPAWVRVDAYVSSREWVRKDKVVERMDRIWGGVGCGGLCVERIFVARRACIQAFCWVCTVLPFLRRMVACHLGLGLMVESEGWVRLRR